MNPLLLKLLPYAAGALAVTLAVLWFGDHERGVERERIAAGHYLQLAEAKMAADRETKRLQGVANAAEQTANDLQADYVAYRAANPVGHVWVCKPAPSGEHGAQPQSPADSAHGGAGPGPEAGGGVPGGSEAQAIDIGPELDTIVSGFAALAVQVSRWQHQPVAQ